jgi:hypothetical protein
MGNFEGDIVAALFGNPHSFGGFLDRVVVGQQRPGQNARGVSGADKRWQDRPLRIDRTRQVPWVCRRRRDRHQRAVRIRHRDIST